MRNVIIGCALLGVVGLGATPVLADCINDMQRAREIVDKMTKSHAKEMAKRELRLAMEAHLGGDEEMCLVHIGLCVHHTKN